MYHFHLLPTVALLSAAAWAYPQNSVCKEVQIPVTVAAPRYIINTKIENDWDAVTFAFNLTRRNAGKPAAPLPIGGMTPEPVLSTFTIGASLCGTGSTVLVLTHGIIESKLYVAPLQQCISSQLTSLDIGSPI